MTPTLRVALLGFSDFEHRGLSSFFRLARPALAPKQVLDPAAADVIVADADNPGAVAQVSALQRMQDTVFIGRRAPAGAAARLPRPIDGLHVLREVELLASRRPDPRAEPEQTAASAPPRTRRIASLSALLVDDSAIALRYLQLRLQRLNIDTDLTHGSGRALELLTQRAYGFVFIDVELGEGSALDGLALCQRIKRQHRHAEGRSPVLVLVSAHHSEVDRARGTFAGCDHYLAKPAEDKALRHLLSQYRPQPAQR